MPKAVDLRQPLRWAVVAVSKDPMLIARPASIRMTAQGIVTETGEPERWIG